MTAALVLVGCLLGASVDVFLRFPGVGAAIVYTPYAIVMTALLRMPAATGGSSWVQPRWEVYFPHLYGGADLKFLVLTEATNHLRALMAAIGLIAFSDARRFDTSRGMVGVSRHRPCWRTLCGCVWRRRSRPVATPVRRLLGGLADVGAVELDRGTHALAAAHDRCPLDRRYGTANARRLAEAMLLFSVLLIVALGVFTNADLGSIHFARLYWPLPFLLWAAARGSGRAVRAPPSWR